MINIKLNKKDLLKEVFCDEIFIDEINKIDQLKNLIPRLNILSLETLRERCFIDKREVVGEELENNNDVNDKILELNDKISEIENQKAIAYTSNNSNNKTLELMDKQKEHMFSREYDLEKVENNKAHSEQLINKIKYLLRSITAEINEIERIRFLDHKLKLFSPDTCPYCLKQVKRNENKCICGNSVSEEEYEKFFTQIVNMLKL